ncbi:hypothetical protein QLG12_09370 [Pseudomonas sp. V88_4]|uniref:leucine-rich repeat domain-containing protein n=1 Tax=Pseudomonas sp. V88_4 TaxID=3044229 RepID=UPI00249E5C09|nr:hypothetical protein [Pseudomonas sp. V88_4]MDI3398410.1 hypothetical protein [Pseudomonas sp. V88_4]
MADKTPKVKAVATSSNSPDFSIDVSRRSPLPASAAPQISMPNRLEPSHMFSRQDLGALTQETSVSAPPISLVTNELAIISALPSLADYRIPKSAHLGDADAQGIRMYKGRQFVQVADDRFVQVVPDAESGLFRATKARELKPSGPLLKPNGEGRFWHAVDSSDSLDRLESLDPVRKRMSVAERVRDLYPQIPDEEVATFINRRLRSDPFGVMTRLENEFAMLRDELAIWSAGEASPHSQSSAQGGALTIAGERRAREQFSAMLQDIWQRKSVSRWGYGDDHFSSNIDFSGELPRLSARFEYVTELILTAQVTGARIGAFLDSFPNVQYLMITGVRVEEFPSGIFQMRELRELTLKNCSLGLTEVTAEGLSRIETLTLLNLAHNPLTVTPHVGFMSELKELMLHDGNLSSIPSGISAPKELGVLALQNNNISDVGDELFDVPDTQHLFVGLVNNPLNNVSRQRIGHYLEDASMDRRIEIQMDEPLSEVESDSESAESGFGTDSDSN